MGHTDKGHSRRYGSVTTGYLAPLHMANTCIFESAEEAAQAFETESRPIYTRWGNPTIAVMEKKIAALENAEAAVATAS